MLHEFQINLTVDDGAATCRAYVLELGDSGQWMWVDDTEFGPFDTTLDVTTWLTRVLTRRKLRSLR